MVTLITAASVTFMLSVVATLAARRFALRAGVVAIPSLDRWHRSAVPLLGGLAVAAAVIVGVALFGVRDPGILALLAAGMVLLLVGLVDDLRSMRPQFKLVWQVIVAAGLISLGLQLRLTGQPSLDIILSLFWIVGITNAFNLLDNMDGLAAGIAAIAVAFRLVFLVVDGNMVAATFAAVLLGAVVGFLIFNFNPASIFMGDAGSLFLGVSVAGLSLVGGFPYSRGTISVLLFPVLILLVPIFDTTFVTIARSLAGRPVSRGGRDHTSHRLVALGLSEREAVLALYLIALLAGGVASLSYFYALSYSVIFLGLLAIAMGILGVYLGRLKVYPEETVQLPETARFFRLIADFSYKRQLAAVAVDCVLIVVAYYSAYLLRFEGTFSDEESLFISSLPLVLVCQLSALALYRVYRGVWRYTSVGDLVRVAQAVTIGTLTAVIGLVMVTRFAGYSRTVFVLDWLLLILLISTARLSFRALEELLEPARDGIRRALIYGAGDGGVLVLRELRNNRALGLSPIGFVDDDRSKSRTTIHGVPVLGGAERLDDLLRLHDVEQVVVSSSKISDDRLATITAVCEARGVAVSRATLRFD